MSQASDAEIIAASEDDPEVFGVVFNRHVGAIYGYLVRRVGPGLAEELTAETFAVAFARRSRFIPLRENVGPWLYGIATNMISTTRRAERRRLAAYERTSLLSAVVDDEFELVDSRIDSGRVTHVLVRALLELRPGDRDALLLLAWQGLTYEEIGTALAIPPGTVASRINRARRHLRESQGQTFEDWMGTP